MAATGVVIDDLRVSFGDVVAVDGVSLRANAGEITALLGPNGAGKTTTLEAAEGYRRSDRGRIEILGLDPIRDRSALSPRVGVMLQRGGVYPSMGAVDVLRLFASYYPGAEQPESLLDRVGLSGRVVQTPWRRLSGGEQQRVSLALALVGRPAVVFLDEPTAGVDPQARQLVRAVIAELRERGVCVVLTTHELEEVERLADQVTIIDRGRVLAAGTPQELMRGDGASVLFAAAPGLDLVALSGALGAEVTEASPGEYVVAATSSPKLVAALTQWLADRDIELDDLRAGRQRLEDVFLRLTGDAP